MNIYIDHNILIHIKDGNLSLPEIEGVNWIFSDEHFVEIKRSKSVELLNTLNNIKATQIKTVLDNRFNMTGEFIVEPYLDATNQYKEYCENIKGWGFVDNIFEPMISRLFGADNFNELMVIPKKIEIVFRKLGLKKILGENIKFFKDEIELITEDMSVLIEEGFQNFKTIEDLRKTLNTDKGKAGSVKDVNTIDEIWGLINKNSVIDFSERLSCDKFFGFEPITIHDKLTHIYYGIIKSHLMLNVVGYRTDKGMSKTENIPNVLSDGNHIAYAAACDGFMSEDKRLCDKTRAIYEYKNINTIVMQVNFS